MNGVSVVVVRLIVFIYLKSGLGQPIVASVVLIEMRIENTKESQRVSE